MSIRGPLGLRIIGFFKLFSAVMLTFAAIGIFHLMGHPVQQNASEFMQQLHLAPQKNLIHLLLSKLTGVGPQKLKAIGAATFIYAILYFIEGIGLLKEKRWAEYMTVIITASLLPFEFISIMHHFDLIHVLVIGFNIVIVIYLMIQLKKNH